MERDKNEAHFEKGSLKQISKRQPRNKGHSK